MHVAEQVARAQAIGGTRFGEAQDLINDADLTSLDAAKEAVDTEIATRHVAEVTFGERTKAGLELANKYDPTILTGGSIAAVSELLPDLDSDPVGMHARL